MTGELFEFKTGYASDYIPDIIPIINDNNVVGIKADPGTGKTTMTTGCISKKKMFKGLIDYFKRPLIVVPFNATNGLYEGPGVNVVASYNSNKFKTSGCNAMVVDQFNKHITEIVQYLPDVIFVDESHELYTGQIYRDSCTKCLENLLHLLGMGVKIVFISATPAGELQLFNAVNSVIEIKGEDKRVLHFEIIRTKDTMNSILKDISELKNTDFDRMAIFSDRDCAQVFENAVSKDVDVTIYHSEYRENVNRLIETEILDHDVSCLTSIAFNGLNIKNEGEKVLIDYRYTYGESTMNEIVQIEGRFRKCDEIVMRIYVDGKNEERSLEDFNRDYNDALVLQEYGAAEFTTPYYERLSDEGTYTALASVKNYKLYFTLKNVIGELKRSGWDVKIEGFDDAKNGKHVKPLKRRASDLMKQSLIEGKDIAELMEGESDVVKRYVSGWQRRLNRLRYLYNAEKIDEAFLERVTMKNKNGEVNSANIESHLTYLEESLKYWQMSDDAWNEWLEIRKKLLADNRISVYLKRRIKEVIKKNDAMREKYKGWEFEDVIGDVIDLHVDVLERYFEGNSKGGKNSAKKLYDTKNDCYYDSCKDASEKLGVSSKVVTKRIKKGELVKVD